VSTSTTYTGLIETPRGPYTFREVSVEAAGIRQAYAAIAALADDAAGEFVRGCEPAEAKP
jgi:hypothetical protein